MPHRGSFNKDISPFNQGDIHIGPRMRTVALHPYPTSEPNVPRATQQSKSLHGMRLIRFKGQWQLAATLQTIYQRTEVQDAIPSRLLKSPLQAGVRKIPAA
jgi:hypothetical protein